MAPRIVIAEPAVRGEGRRLSGIFFLGTVLIAQVSWLGALGYAAFRLL